MEHINSYKVTDNCEVDADTKESLVRHLEEHGIMSLLTSHKFAPDLSCVVKGIGEAMAETGTPIAPAGADDATGNQEAAAPPADEATESPAAMRTRPKPGELPPVIGNGEFDRKPVARRSRLNNRSPRCY